MRLRVIVAVGALLAGPLWTVAAGGGTEAPTPQTSSTIAAGQYRQAPMLDALVNSGELPPVDERLPPEPLVIEPWESVGEYGGTWRVLNQRNDRAYEALHYYEPLLRFQMYDFAVIPNVAKSWSSADGKVFTFRLRQGIRWSDGDPFDANDVKFWFEDLLGNEEIFPTFPTWLVAGGERPRFEVIDDYTVRFSYTNEAALFLRQMGHPWNEAFRPMHYLQDFHPGYVAADKLNATARERGFDNWARLFLDRMEHNTNEELPVLFAWHRESAQTDGATYVRNPYYWKVDTAGNQLPYIDRVQVSIVANTEVAQLKTFGGEHDLDMFVVGQFPRDTMVLKENEQVGNYKVIDAPIAEPNTFILGLNLNHRDPVLREIFQDRRFRIAMSHAIKREDLRQLIYLEQPQEIRQVAPKRESPFYHDAAAQNYVQYDPARSNQLLDEMGLTRRNADGIRLRPDGKPLEIVLETYSFRDDFQDALELIAGWWTEVGVRASSKAIEGSLFGRRRNSAEFDASADFAGNGLYPLMRPFDYIPVSNGNNFAPLWGLWYASKGSSGEEPPAEVKRQMELYDQALVTADVDEQVRLWRQIMDIHAEHMFHLGGCCDRATVPVPVHNRFRNVPDEGWNAEWVVGNIGVTNPSQFWIAE